MTYQVELSEPAEAEADSAYLWMLQRSPERAATWYDGFLRAIQTLDTMPTRCPLARESARFNREIRQLLYGRGRNAYRILFTITDLDSTDEAALVRILHVRHSSRADIGEE
jgi:plasmid stabilization system protein ParE